MVITMDCSVLKIIAYTVDAGKHAEYVMLGDEIDLVVFSHGIMLENRMLEIVVAFDVEMLPFTVAPSVPVQQYRDNFRSLFGFDGLYYCPLDNKIQHDRAMTRLAKIVYESMQDVDITEYGAIFATTRQVNRDGNPNPVFWINGYLTDSASEGEEELFKALRTLCDDHLQRRHTKSLLSRAAGFCPHLAG